MNDEKRCQITTASVKELSYIIDLAKKFSEQLGFLPRAAVVEYLTAGRVLLARENGEPAGFILSRNRLRSEKWCRPLTQVAVSFDAQRRHHGHALLETLKTQARRDMLEGLQCWVAEEIEAVQFFTAEGFQHVQTRDPMNKRNRRLLLMRLNLNLTENPRFRLMPSVAGCVPRRTDAA
jgi:N-acetylglutamate synthase-like GNAT family acetyltransferase